MSPTNLRLLIGETKGYLVSRIVDTETTYHVSVDVGCSSLDDPGPLVRETNRNKVPYEGPT